jgi:hypothetical protein
MRTLARAARHASASLKIALIVCGAAVTWLWVRSQHHGDVFAMHMRGNVVAIESYTNAIGLFILSHDQINPSDNYFSHASYPPAVIDHALFGSFVKSYGGGFGIIMSREIPGVVLPPWPAPLLGGTLLVAFIFRAARRRIRCVRGHCLVCNYDLTANESGVCPECGTVLQNAS